MPDPMTNPHENGPDDVVRPHTFDGIQEYDKRLPRWWLVTLFGTIAFAVLYWAYYHAYHIGPTPLQTLEHEMAENAERVARLSGVVDDDALWKMSNDPQFIGAGKGTFDTTCAACHKPDLTGLIGPNLVDQEWIHGGNPMDALKTINDGVLAKGMPAWGPVLGKQKINELVAYIFSHHRHGEAAVAVPGWTPGAPTSPAPQ